MGTYTKICAIETSLIGSILVVTITDVKFVTDSHQYSASGAFAFSYSNINSAISQQNATYVCAMCRDTFNRHSLQLVLKN